MTEFRFRLGRKYFEVHFMHYFFPMLSTTHREYDYQLTSSVLFASLDMGNNSDGFIFGKLS